MPRPRHGLLYRKIGRDALALGGTGRSLVILMAIGAALNVAFNQTRLNLIASYETFYGRHRFADATILVEQAPGSLLDTVRLIPGVRAVVGRPVRDGTIILRDSPRRRVTGRFIGVPATVRPEVNDLQVVEGRYLSSRQDLMLEKQFAELNRLKVGDLLTASYLGRQHDFRIVAIVTSPEYLYPAPSKEAAFASPQAFGVCWIDEDAARQWLGLGDRITEVHALVAPKLTDYALEVMKALGRRHGLRSFWDQATQPSNNLLQMDLTGYLALSVMFPGLFMIAAGLSLYSSLTRIVRLQTGVVGFLRASGFSRQQVLWHYVLQGGLIAGLGAGPGVLLGHFISVWLTRLYVGIINLPGAVIVPHFDNWLGCLTVSTAIGLLAAWVPARSAAATAPAVAMRGDRADDERPGRAPWLEALCRRAPILWRISLRGLLRRPSRTLFAVGGIVGGAALLLTTMGLHTSVMAALDEFLYETRQYELDVSFIRREGLSLGRAAAGFPGVTSVVRTCTATVHLRSATGELTTLLSGLEAGQRVFRLAGLTGRLPDYRPGEIWITPKMAERLRVEPGDPLLVEWAFASRQRAIDTVMTVGGLLDATMGAQAYGDFADLDRRLMARLGSDALYGVMIACSAADGQALRRWLERDSLVAAVVSLDDIKTEIDASLGMQYIFITVLLCFSSVLAGAALHAVSSVGILERLRELATLRSLGFGAAATALAAAVEVYLMALLGLLIGLPVGRRMCLAYMALFETETMSFRAVIPPGAYALTALIVFALVAVSLRAGLIRLRTMDLAQATKARE